MKVRSEATQTGMDTRRIWRFGQRDGRISQAYLTVRRGIRPSATQTSIDLKNLMSATPSALRIIIHTIPSSRSGLFSAGPSSLC
jgi:hypothetical protein